MEYSGTIQMIRITYFWTLGMYQWVKWRYTSLTDKTTVPATITAADSKAAKSIWRLRIWIYVTAGITTSIVNSVIVRRRFPILRANNRRDECGLEAAAAREDEFAKILSDSPEGGNNELVRSLSSIRTESSASGSVEVGGPKENISLGGGRPLLTSSFGSTILNWTLSLYYIIWYVAKENSVEWNYTVVSRVDDIDDRCEAWGTWKRTKSCDFRCNYHTQFCVELCTTHTGVMALIRSNAKRGNEYNPHLTLVLVVYQVLHSIGTYILYCSTIIHPQSSPTKPAPPAVILPSTTFFFLLRYWMKHPITKSRLFYILIHT